MTLPSSLTKSTAPYYGDAGNTNIWENISVTKFPLALPMEAIERVASIDGPVDVFCWYEGKNGLSKEGAAFMKNAVIKPLAERKKDVKLYLYSLVGWQFDITVSRMGKTTKTGEAVNRINCKAIECLYASSFFRYCVDRAEMNPVYQYLKTEMPKKKWLIDLSALKTSDDEPVVKRTVAELFEHRPSLLGSCNDLKVDRAYSLLQYVEGYYLIQRSVREKLAAGCDKINLVFLLPNDEDKYYKDYPEEIGKLLRLDFGEKLDKAEINISFLPFSYGDGQDDRPYSVKEKITKENWNELLVAPREVRSYFDFIQPPCTPKKQVEKLQIKNPQDTKPRFDFTPRDEIHALYLLP